MRENIENTNINGSCDFFKRKIKYCVYPSKKLATALLYGKLYQKHVMC